MSFPKFLIGSPGVEEERGLIKMDSLNFEGHE
jgi:hypothetical protein